MPQLYEFFQIITSLPINRDGLFLNLVLSEWTNWFSPYDSN